MLVDHVRRSDDVMMLTPEWGAIALPITSMITKCYSRSDRRQALSIVAILIPSSCSGAACPGGVRTTPQECPASGHATTSICSFRLDDHGLILLLIPETGSIKAGLVSSVQGTRQHL